MSLDGIWAAEMHGLFGWENFGMLALEDGRVMGGGNNHIAFGRFEADGDAVNISLSLIYHGTPRHVFGSADTSFSIDMRGRHGDDAIEGEMHRPDRSELSLPFRLTRRADLP